MNGPRIPLSAGGTDVLAHHLALAAVVAAAVAGAVLAREKDPQRRAGALVKIGAALMTVFTVAAVAFISGDALDQPAGWRG